MYPSTSDSLGGEVDGALRETRAKLALLKQQLADLSNAVTQASDTLSHPSTTALSNNEIMATGRPSPPAFPNKAATSRPPQVYSSAPPSIYNDDLIPESMAVSMPLADVRGLCRESDSLEGDTRENRVDGSGVVESEDSVSVGFPRLVSPFARFAGIDFEQQISVTESEDGSADVIVEGLDVKGKSVDEGAKEEGEESDGSASLVPELATVATEWRRSASPDEASVPQTPNRSEVLDAYPSVGAKSDMTEDMDVKQDAQENPASAFNKDFPILESGIHMLGGMDVHGNPAFGIMANPMDALGDESQNDPISWILTSLGPYTTWPNIQRGEGGKMDVARVASHAKNGVVDHENAPILAAQISSAARGIRDAISKLWVGGGIQLGEDLLEVVAAVVENEEFENRIDPKSCWLSGRSLTCTADGLPFAFTVHTYSSPGLPCTSGKANVSAEVRSAESGKVPSFKAMRGNLHDDQEYGRISPVPSTPRDESKPDEAAETLTPRSSSPQRAFSGQLVNGHVIATHQSLEQHPARVVDISLDRRPSGDPNFLDNLNRSLSGGDLPGEVAESSRKGGLKFENVSPLASPRSSVTRNVNERDVGDDPTNNFESFSFHSSSSRSSMDEREDEFRRVDDDQMGTADLSAFIRGGREGGSRRSKRGSVDFDHHPMENAELSLFLREGGPSNENRGDQYDTADMTNFIREGSSSRKWNQPRLTPVEEANKVAAEGPSAPGAMRNPSYASVDLVWEVQYLRPGEPATADWRMRFAPREEEEESSERLWETYPGDTDSEGSVRESEMSLDGEPNPPTSKFDEDILRSASLKGFLANQAEQRKNSRRRMNADMVKDHQHEGGEGLPPRPPRPPTQGTNRPDSSRPPLPPRQGSRRGLQDAGPSQEESEDPMAHRRKKPRMPKFSKFVRRVRRLMRNRDSMGNDGYSALQADSVESEELDNVPPPVRSSSQTSPRVPEKHIRATQSDSALGKSLASSNLAEMGVASEDLGDDRTVEVVKRSSLGSSSDDPPQGGELIVAKRQPDPNALQDAFWGVPSSVSLPVKDLGNGRYLVMGHLAGEGLYEISVKVGGKQVTANPVTFEVLPPKSLGSGITPDGPFYPHPDLPLFPTQTTALSPHPNFPPCHSVSYDEDRLEYARNHPHIGCVDICFVVDSTASMTAEIAELPNVVREMWGLVSEAHLCKRIRFGVVAYRDHWPEDDHPFVLSKLDFTEDVEKVCNFILSLEASGGGDYPEALEAALLEAAEGVTWWPFSARLVVWVGDAPPHGYEGMGPKQTMEHEEGFLRAKERVKQAAAALDFALRGGKSKNEWTEQDEELAAAVTECDKLAMYHDNFPLGVPGGVPWEEAAERLAAVGARVIAMGLRDAIFHAPSQMCLRSIAHLTGGALLEVGSLEGSVVGPLTTAIVEQLLDQQLIEEEVCDLVLYCRSELKRENAQERRHTVSETMTQASKRPHRLQVLPAESDMTDVSEASGGESEEAERQPAAAKGAGGGSGRRSPVPAETSAPPATPRTAPGAGDGRPPSRSRGPGHVQGGSFSSSGCFQSNTSSSDTDNLALEEWKGDGTESLLLGMQSVKMDEKILEQVLKGLRSKAETVGLALQAGFGSQSSWLDTYGKSFGELNGPRGRRVVKRVIEEVLTSPLALRYLLAEQNFSGMLGG